MARKTIHIHVGPHKTGSTAIQHAMRDHADLIKASIGVTPVFDQAVGALAKALLQEDETATETHLATLVARGAETDGDCLISSEDLAGDLPGRTGRRRAYPRLMANLNTLRRAFPDCDVRFYFFLRDRDPWLRSAYVQLLKYRTKFQSFDAYLGFLKNEDAIWDGILTRPRARLGEGFVEIPYEEGGFSAVQALLDAIGGRKGAVYLPEEEPRPNSSPDAGVIKLLELANGSGASDEAVKAAKRRLQDTTPSPRSTSESFPDWPPRADRPDWLSEGLGPLWSRAGNRVHRQDQPNLLPPLDCDLTPYRLRPVDASDQFPEGGRQHMENQVSILAYRFRGMPEICFLLGLTISYLRRDTDHTAHAAQLFQRLWAEEHEVMLGLLQTRWLISAFQTFMDHGANDAQRTVGAAAYFMANTLKLYEAERALDGLPPDRTYPNEKPTTKSGFWGMDRFALGGTDLMLNQNALLLDLASRDATAGRVVQEFLLRLKAYNSAFSRMDRSRIAHDVQNPQFANCWSFFEPPND